MQVAQQQAGGAESSEPAGEAAAGRQSRPAAENHKKWQQNQAQARVRAAA